MQDENSGSEYVNKLDKGRFQKVMYIIAGLLLAFATLIIAVYVLRFPSGELGNQEVFAQFGDYVGGLINPIVGFGTIILLIYSLRFQSGALGISSEELKLTREEMGRANEEAKRNANASFKLVEQAEAQNMVAQANDTLSRFKENLIDILGKENLVNQKIQDHIREQYKEEFSKLPNEGRIYEYKLTHKIRNAHNKNHENIAFCYYLGAYKSIELNGLFIENLNQIASNLDYCTECICMMIEKGGLRPLIQYRLDEIWWIINGSSLIGVVSTEVRNNLKKLIDNAIARRRERYGEINFSLKFN
jgi:hypothetical protein